MCGHRRRFQSEDPAGALGCNWRRWRGKLGGGDKRHQLKSKAASYWTSAVAMSETGSGADDCNPRRRLTGPQRWWNQRLRSTARVAWIRGGGGGFESGDGVASIVIVNCGQGGIQLED
jgi:hypothetical protein